MLMQSPPMQAAGKSHSSMSAEDQRGGESQGLTPHLRLPSLSTEPQVGPAIHAPSCIWMRAGHGDACFIYRLLLDLGPGRWRFWGREEQVSPPSSGHPPLPSQRLRSLDRW